MPDHGLGAYDPAHWESVPDAVIEYANLDLGADSAVAKALFEGLEKEVTNPAELIHLQEERSDRTSDLTPHMSAWYHYHVAPIRAAALDAVRARFSEDRIRGVPTILFEASRDQVNQDSAKRIHDGMANFRANHKGDMYARDAAYQVYQAAKATHQREPVVTKKLFYLSILFSLAILEFFMNFKTMLASPMSYGIPALALALTAGAALFIGTASHIDGTMVKQWQYWMHGLEPERKRRCLTLLISSGALLLLGLGAIAFGRFYYATAIIQNQILLGNVPPSVISLMTGTMVGNVGIWLVGAYVAYVMHDSDPEYPDLKVRHDELNSKVEKAYAAVTEQTRALNEKARTDVDALRVQHDSQYESRAFQSNRKQFEKVVAKDRLLVGLIRTYREAFRRKYPLARLTSADSDLADPTGRTEISSAQWAGADLTLKYNRGSDA
jgi:hypothetical protein